MVCLIFLTGILNKIGGPIGVKPRGQPNTSVERYENFCEQSPVIERQTWNSNKRVLTFSLFAPLSLGQDPASEKLFRWFVSGAQFNVRDAKLYYPGWIVRIYLFGTLPEVELILSNEDHVEVVRCPMGSRLASSNSRMMISRFLAYDDPKVEYIISRDVDSRLHPRELFAVNEWLASGMHFHAMRDNKEHDTEVLGGMFGMKRGALDHASLSALLSQALNDNPEGILGAPGEDQSFLQRYVWPIVKGDTLNHDDDAERCVRYGAKRCSTFPFNSKHLSTAHSFVGQSFKPPLDDEDGDFVSHYVCDISCVPAVVHS